MDGHEKNWRPELGPDDAKLSPKLFFLLFSQVWFIIFLETAYNNSLQRCIRCGRGKIMKKKILDPNLGQRCQNWAPNFVFLSFLCLYFMLFYLK